MGDKLKVGDLVNIKGYPDRLPITGVVGDDFTIEPKQIIATNWWCLKDLKNYGQCGDCKYAQVLGSKEPCKRCYEIHPNSGERNWFPILPKVQQVDETDTVTLSEAVNYLLMEDTDAIFKDITNTVTITRNNTGAIQIDRRDKHFGVSVVDAKYILQKKYKQMGLLQAIESGKPLRPKGELGAIGDSATQYINCNGFLRNYNDYVSLAAKSILSEDIYRQALGLWEIEEDV